MTQELWEILVPTVHRVSRKPIKLKFHRVWDEKVKAITHGLTILPVARGYWKDLPQERMIPVRIACTNDQVKQILKMTKDYYDQEAIMAYRVSSEVIFYE